MPASLCLYEELKDHLPENAKRLKLSSMNEDFLEVDEDYVQGVIQTKYDFHTLPYPALKFVLHDGSGSVGLFTMGEAAVDLDKLASEGDILVCTKFCVELSCDLPTLVANDVDDETKVLVIPKNSSNACGTSSDKKSPLGKHSSLAQVSQPGSSRHEDSSSSKQVVRSVIKSPNRNLVSSTVSPANKSSSGNTHQNVRPSSSKQRRESPRRETNRKDVLSQPSPKKAGIRYSYKALSDVAANTVVNVYGIVTFTKTPAQSRGSDFYCLISIQDPSLAKTGEKLSCNIFSKSSDDLPRVDVGDVVRFHRLKVQKFQGKRQGYNGPGFQWLVFPEGSVGRKVASSMNFSFCEEDKNEVKRLSEWWDQVGSSQGAIPSTTLCQAQPREYFNLICQIIRIGDMRSDTDCKLLRVWDGTKFEGSIKEADLRDYDESTLVEDRNLLTVSDDLAVDIYLFENHAETAANFQPGDFIKLTNLHAAVVGGQVELTLHRGTAFNRGARVLSPDSPEVIPVSSLIGTCMAAHACGDSENHSMLDEWTQQPQHGDREVSPEVEDQDTLNCPPITAQSGGGAEGHTGDGDEHLNFGSASLSPVQRRKIAHRTSKGKGLGKNRVRMYINSDSDSNSNADTSQTAASCVHGSRPRTRSQQKQCEVSPDEEEMDSDDESVLGNRSVVLSMEEPEDRSGARPETEMHESPLGSGVVRDSSCVQDGKISSSGNSFDDSGAQQLDKGGADSSSQGTFATAAESCQLSSQDNLSSPSQEIISSPVTIPLSLKARSVSPQHSFFNSQQCSEEDQHSSTNAEGVPSTEPRLFQLTEEDFVADSEILCFDTAASVPETETDQLMETADSDLTMNSTIMDTADPVYSVSMDDSFSTPRCILKTASAIVGHVKVPITKLKDVLSHSMPCKFKVQVKIGDFHPRPQTVSELFYVYCLKCKHYEQTRQDIRENPSSAVEQLCPVCPDQKMQPTIIMMFELVEDDCAVIAYLWDTNALQFLNLNEPLELLTRDETFADIKQSLDALCPPNFTVSERPWFECCIFSYKCGNKTKYQIFDTVLIRKELK
ncbi:uncharacterized protein LOC101863193 [Aplysia californica]|uniref:Protection of telomeres protein 1 n=1 Tax=Aplysia californica TaxID=6500 RepID=A0ABM1A2A5_APLCA|nr:uncharacterized protein LOC101863193 [Aplysia californica]XP_012939380.1 uncharacterized protein LOC101863193 [Aplysia californica]XP_035826283.1 uncharacterized protein LOC101863193 [Aplysia californica]XP_035826285.1 uncharacterized protein LOC101863193 [Aplysia californica]